MDLEQRLHNLKTKILRTTLISEDIRIELSDEIFEIEKLVKSNIVLYSISTCNCDEPDHGIKQRDGFSTDYCRNCNEDL